MALVSALGTSATAGKRLHVEYHGPCKDITMASATQPGAWPSKMRAPTAVAAAGTDRASCSVLGAHQIEGANDPDSSTTHLGLLHVGDLFRRDHLRLSAEVCRARPGESHGLSGTAAQQLSSPRASNDCAVMQLPGPPSFCTWDAIMTTHCS